MLNFAKDLAAALDALRRHAILFLLGVTLIALALLGRSWLDAHDASLKLQATLAAQQKTITDADQRQSTRDAQLTQTLAQITAAKQKIQTPTQAAAALTQAFPQLIAGGPGGKPLPSPITIDLPAASVVSKSSATTSISANTTASDITATSANNLSSNTDLNSDKTSDSGSNSSAAKKYPWTALKLGLAKLGIGHTPVASAIQPGVIANASSGNSGTATKDSQTQKGSAASQKGSSAQQTLSVSQSANETPTSESSAQTNSPPRSGANALTILTPQGNVQSQAAANSATNLPPAIIRVPQEDLKPLYDAVEDCQACAAKLAAAQGDLSDEKTKFAAATAARDAAISAVHGTFWKRARTAAKWIVIGAVAGAVLARYH